MSDWIIPALAVSAVIAAIWYIVWNASNEQVLKDRQVAYELAQTEARKMGGELGPCFEPEYSSRRHVSCLYANGDGELRLLVCHDYECTLPDAFPAP